MDLLRSAVVLIFFSFCKKKKLENSKSEKWVYYHLYYFITLQNKF